MRKTMNATLRKRLLRELSMVSRGAGLRDALHVEAHAEPIDQLQAEEDRELACERIDSRTRIAHDIELALRKLDEGRYGTCDECGCTIPPARLKALPWATHCVPCRSEMEQNSAAA